MPVRLDTRRIVRLDDMNRFDLLGEFNADLTLSSKPIIRTADLVLTTRAVLNKVDVPDSYFLGWRFLLVGRGGR